jgi:hypothetical protein
LLAERIHEQELRKDKEIRQLREKLEKEDEALAELEQQLLDKERRMKVRPV